MKKVNLFFLIQLLELRDDFFLYILLDFILGLLLGFTKINLYIIQL